MNKKSIKKLKIETNKFSNIKTPRNPQSDLIGETGQEEDQISLQSIQTRPKLKLPKPSIYQIRKRQHFQSPLVTQNNYKKFLSQCKFSKDQKESLKLNQSLQQFRQKYNLDQRKLQIRSNGVFKKIKKFVSKTNCELKVSVKGAKIKSSIQSQGFLKNKSKKYLLDRCAGKQLSKDVKSHSLDYGVLNVKLKKGERRVLNLEKRQRESKSYEAFSVNQMKIQLNKIRSKQAQIPFHIKKQLQKKIQKMNCLKETQNVKNMIQGTSFTLSDDSKSIDLSLSNDSHRETSSDFSRTKRQTQTSRINIFNINEQMKSKMKKQAEEINCYKEQITQFQQIIAFFHQIHHQLLKYQQNLHLTNKIKLILQRSEYRAMTRLIFNKSFENLSYFTQRRIVKIIIKYKNILTNLNYIVNIIKLNISTQRRNRVEKKQSQITVSKNFLVKKANAVLNRVKFLDRRSIKEKVVDDFTKKINIDISSQRLFYKKFENKMIQLKRETQQDPEEFSPKVKIMCDILQFETLIM